MIIDNYDSFTYNLVHYFEQLDDLVHIVQHDKATIKAIKACNPDLIVLSPGPGKPSDSKISRDVLFYLGNQIPILGVCLGHQAIIEYFGGQITKGNKPIHGKVSTIVHNEKGIFKNIPQSTSVTRYHSLVALEQTLPDSLDVSAKSEDGAVMGVVHQTMPITGIQFHPESITTIAGFQMLENSYNQAKLWKSKSIGGSMHEKSISAL